MLKLISIKLIVRPLILVILLFLQVLSHSQETVIIRTDRDVYVSGEHFWVYINCIENQSFQTSGLSKVVYVELINSQKIPVLQIKCKLENGQVQTRAIIPDSLSTGNYILRAYTQWMRNYHEKYYGKKIVTIINPFNVNSLPKTDKNFSTDTVLLYTEGGKLLRGVENKIVLRSMNEFGRAVAINGAILSPNNDTLCLVKTNKRGFGTSVFYLNAIGTYRLVYFIDGIKKSIQLPKVENIGYNLRILEQDEKQTVFKIFSLDSSNIDRLSVDLTTVNGDLLGTFLVKEQSRVIIPYVREQKGILHALLLDENKQVLSSRHFSFENKINDPSLSLSLSKEKYQPRDKVDLTILNNNSNSGLKYLSVSVVKSGLINDKYSSPYFYKSYAHLNRRMKAWVDSTITYNDLLSMIDEVDHDVVKQRIRLRVPELNGEIVSGVITNEESGEPLVGKRIVLNFVSKYPTFDLALTDSLGRFVFVVNQYGEKEMVIQPLLIDTSKINYKVTLDPSFSGVYDQIPVNKLILEKDRVEKINTAIINAQINTIYDVCKPIPLKLDSIISSIPFYGNSETTTIIDKFIELPSVEEVINEIVRYTYVRRQNGEYSFKVLEGKSFHPKDGQTMTFVDGIPIYDASRILAIAPKEISRVEVINLNYYIEGVNLGRLLFFYTIDGNLKAMEFDNKIFRQARQCYAFAYEFNGPDYSDENIKNSKQADFRNLLYFHTIESLDSIETKVSFYAADESTDYTIIVKGINSEGSIESTEIPLEVTE